MNSSAEQAAGLSEQVQQAISQVRGSARTPGGAVQIETDANGLITDLQLSRSALSVEPDQLARAITQCHETAVERAQAEVGRVFAQLRDTPMLPTPKTPVESTEWEELAPSRITHSV
ncbi:YbaB/EbfC family nucleoid-associated protein [Nocardia sp. NPDC059240]|uniref:YbaB/EbfC family nucleoid-associated protein n=1 Tax=Nocardia sp. NPDC059240 TaxID=3346786 RepID=UPI0036CB5AED